MCKKCIFLGIFLKIPLSFSWILENHEDSFINKNPRSTHMLVQKNSELTKENNYLRQKIAYLERKIKHITKKQKFSLSQKNLFMK